MSRLAVDWKSRGRQIHIVMQAPNHSRREESTNPSSSGYPLNRLVLFYRPAKEAGGNFVVSLTISRAYKGAKRKSRDISSPLVLSLTFPQDKSSYLPQSSSSESRSSSFPSELSSSS